MEAAKRVAARAVDDLVACSMEAFCDAKVGRWSIMQLARFVKTHYRFADVSLCAASSGKAEMHFGDAVPKYRRKA